MFPIGYYPIEMLYLFKLILDCKDSEEVPKRQSLSESMFDKENIKKRRVFSKIRKQLQIHFRLPKMFFEIDDLVVPHDNPFTFEQLLH